MNRSFKLNNFKAKQQAKTKAKEQYQTVIKNVNKIKKIALKQIAYPEYKEAYDYVDNLFPQVSVKEVTIYKVAAKDLAKMGYGGAEGFYDNISKTVVVCGARKSQRNINKGCSVIAKIERDEVIVHELIHYCYFDEGNYSNSTQMKEEFAYGWSLGYLRQKGYSDEYIIKYNFLPFLVNSALKKATKYVLAQNDISNREYNSHTSFKRKEFNRKYGRKVFVRAKEIGMERGYELINLYSKKLEGYVGHLDSEKPVGRFDLLDL